MERGGGGGAEMFVLLHTIAQTQRGADTVCPLILQEHSMSYAMACDLYAQLQQSAKGEQSGLSMDCTQRALDDLIAHRQV